MDTGVGNNCAPPHSNLNSRYYEGLRHKLGLELVPSAEISICHTNVPASINACENFVKDKVFANIEPMTRKPWDPRRKTRLEKIVWQIMNSALGANSKPSLWRSPL